MLESINVLKIEVELITGLYIGGTDNGFDIGGADTNVIKNPLTKEPYIPGSSLKGKLKSLLKYRYGEIIKGTEIQFKDDNLTMIFEPLNENNHNRNVLISRAIFRDLIMSEESKDMLEIKLGKGVFTETKAENKINSLNGKSDSPRFIERVPAGVKFVGEIVLNCFDDDNKEKMEEYILESLKLLEYNYLGGNGTRGYGKVRINILGNGFEKVK